MIHNIIEAGQVFGEMALLDGLPRSADAIAGICDPTGRIFGLMPHPDRFLSWHGIEAISGGLGDPDVSPSEAIIGQAAEMDADLIVMGAYGHARLREIILGGVTRDLLKRAPTCLMLSH